MSNRLDNYLSSRNRRRYDSLNESILGTQLLEGKTEVVKDLVLDNRFNSLSSPEAVNTMSKLLENTEESLRSSGVYYSPNAELITESVVQQDVAKFYNLLMPLIRKTWGQTISQHLLGVWPIKSRNQLVYGLLPQFRASNKYERVDLAIYEVNQNVAERKDDDLEGEKVIHVEKNKVLLTTKNGKKSVGDNLGTYTITRVYSNIANYGRILKNFSETDISDNIRPKINEVGLEVVATTVTAKSRKLRAEYSVEVLEDLRDQFGVSADEELIDIMSNIIRLDIDSEIVDWVNTTATQYEDYDFSTSNAKDPTVANANKLRTEEEKASALALHIAFKSNEIASRTQRGKANVLLTTPNVATVLSRLKNFVRSTVDSNIPVLGVDPYFYGEIDGIKIVVDTNADQGYDYCTLVYKGDNRQDTMGWYCPYIPLTLQTVQNSQTGTPALIFHTSYAIAPIPGLKSADSTDRAALYASTFSVTNII